MAVSARQRLINEVKLRLGGGMIDLEADPEHYDLAVTMAVDRYRQRSDNSFEESFIFLDTAKDVDVYTLPPEVQLVRYVYRRGISGASGGTAIDPFSLAFTNNLYMISNPGGMNSGGTGTLATYDLAVGFQEMAAKMFGREVIFTWNPSSHKIKFHRKFSSTETILLHVYNKKPEDMIIDDVMAKPWIRDYSVAAAKMIIGEARSKFAQLAGPQGGVSLNGDAMKQEGVAEMERLEEEIKNQIPGGVGYGFTIG